MDQLLLHPVSIFIYDGDFQISDNNEASFGVCVEYSDCYMSAQTNRNRKWLYEKHRKKGEENGKIDNSKSNFFLLKFERFMIGTLYLYLRRAVTVLRQIKMEEEEQNMISEKLLNRHEIQHKYVRI